MVATIYGWEMVCPAAIGRALSSYARAASSAGANRSRGTARQAARTHSSRMPRAAICSRTIASRAAANSAGVGMGAWTAAGIHASEGPANDTPHVHLPAITVPVPSRQIVVARPLVFLLPSSRLYPRTTPLSAPRNRPGCPDLDRRADPEVHRGGGIALVDRDLVQPGASQYHHRTARGNGAVGARRPAHGLPHDREYHLALRRLAQGRRREVGDGVAAPVHIGHRAADRLALLLG